MNNRYFERLKNLEDACSLRATYDDGELTLEALNRAGSAVARIRFADILLTRVSDEGTRLRLFQDLGNERAFLMVDGRSDVVSWISDESFRTRDVREAKHFLVFAGEEVVDVVSLSEPDTWVHSPPC